MQNAQNIVSTKLRRTTSKSTFSHLSHIIGPDARNGERIEQKIVQMHAHRHGLFQNEVQKNFLQKGGERETGNGNCFLCSHLSKLFSLSQIKLLCTLVNDATVTTNGYIIVDAK